MRRTLDGILVLSLLLAPAWPSFGQTFGQITGLVTDASGAILAGASVTVTSTQTNATRTAQTNAAWLNFGKMAEGASRSPIVFAAVAPWGLGWMSVAAGVHGTLALESAYQGH